MATKHTGKQFGSLLVLDGWSETTASGNPKQIFRVRCSCGQEYRRAAVSILYAKNKSSLRCSSCAEQAHGAASATGYKHPLYRIWWGMVQRCYNPLTAYYIHYGGRGVTVCDHWRGDRPNGEAATVDGFHNFVADMGERPSGHTLDRRDNNKGYSADNCRWATKKQQQNNKRTNVYVTLGGRTLSITEWGERLGHPSPSMWAARARAFGIPLEEALALLVAHYPNPVSKWKKIFAPLLTA
jgi:hypothetical protein